MKGLVWVTSAAARSISDHLFQTEVTEQIDCNAFLFSQSSRQVRSAIPVSLQ